MRAVFESLAGHHDAIDPGLELARNGEIVHRRAEHDDVGGKKFVQDRLAGGEVRLEGCFGHRALSGGKMGAGKVRQRCQREVAIDDFEAAGRFGQTVYDRGGNLPADGMGAEDAGIDMQEFHEGHPWYMFVTQTI